MSQACVITALENSGAIFFTLVLNKWWEKLVIQVLVEYQVPNFEMAISFELRLEYVHYAYHWNRQGITSLKNGKK